MSKVEKIVDEDPSSSPTNKFTSSDWPGKQSTNKNINYNDSNVELVK